jgi:hypothetical protein
MNTRHQLSARVLQFRADFCPVRQHRVACGPAALRSAMRMTAAILLLGLTATWTFAAEASPSPGNAKAADLRFVSQEDGFTFNTGLLRGALRQGGQSLGLKPVVDAASGGDVAGNYGILSHYRLLDDQNRYGHAAWDWASQTRLGDDGAAETRWTADDAHPFDLVAHYRWAAPNTVDLTTQVTARRNLTRIEIFLASYFNGLDTSQVYVQQSSAEGGQAGWMPAVQAHGPWQMFPRDEQAVKTIRDGRWTRPPSPVEWQIMPTLAAPLALRRNEQTGLTAVIMTPPADCFAVSTPYSGEGHRSLYFSLFGCDLTNGQTAAARTRLIIGPSITDAQAVALYQDYLKAIAENARAAR